MTAFRALLALMIVVLAAYTLVVVANYGANLAPVFFGEITRVTWQGQFNLDFLSFLILSAAWLSWRHTFTPTGLLIGAFGLVGGILFLAPYLLIVSFQAKGDMRELLLGRARVV